MSCKIHAHPHHTTVLHNKEWSVPNAEGSRSEKHWRGRKGGREAEGQGSVTATRPRATASPDRKGSGGQAALFSL